MKIRVKQWLQSIRSKVREMLDWANSLCNCESETTRTSGCAFLDAKETGSLDSELIQSLNHYDVF